MNGADTHPCASWWGEGVWGWVGVSQRGEQGDGTEKGAGNCALVPLE